MLVACAPADTVIDRTFDACQPVLVDGATASADQRGGISDAITLWRSRGVTTLTEAATADVPRVRVVFEEASPAFHGYYDDEAAVIYVNTDLDRDPAARAVTIAHELGHAFGLYHVDPEDEVSVMNPHNLTVTPTEGDRLDLERLWGPCAP